MPDPLRFTISTLRQALGAFTLPAEQVFYPFFGTRYFNPVIAAMAFVATYCAVFFPGFLAYNRDVYTHLPVHLIKVFYLIYAVHFVRIIRLMRDPRQEIDSEWEGWPLLGFLPFAGSWAIRRIIIEPAVVFAFFVFLRINHAFIFSNYVLFVAFALALKAALTWYESWIALRDVLDKSHRTSVLQDFTQNISGGTVGRFPLSPLANAPANERDGLVAAIARID